MSLSSLVQQGFNAASSINPGAVLAKVTPNDQVTGQALAIGNTAIEWLKHPGGSQVTEPALLMGNTVIEWVKHPEVVKYIIAPGATFSTVSVGLANLGFNSAGIGAGTAAAAIQSSLYGGAVPAGGYFATLQSMGALGTLSPVGMGVAAGLAGSVALVGWVSGVGS